MNTLTDCFNVIYSYNLDFIGSEETGDIVDDCGSIDLGTIDILIDLLEDASGNLYIWISSDWWCQDIYFRWYGKKEDFGEWMHKVLLLIILKLKNAGFWKVS